MKQFIYLSVAILLTAAISSCGDTGKKGDGGLANKKGQLEKLKSQKDQLDEKINVLQKDIAKLDTSAVVAKPKLVSLTAISKGDFKHYLDLQGSVDAKNISYITPRGQPGQIKAIYVKQGDRIHKGQLILKLDDAVARENVTAIKQQLGGIKAQLALAQSVYSRQQNLWDQHIGTEVQLLKAKTDVETLQNQMKAAQAQVNAAQEQANQSNIYSDVNGTVDDLTAHVGETFSGNPTTGGYIKIVNNTDLKITVIVPENYAQRVVKGSAAIIQVPDLNVTFNSSITFISQTIGTTSRGFTAEIRVPQNIKLRPNQIALVKILDYTSPNSIAIPLNTLQTGEKGKYVLVAEKQGDKLLAEKKDVVIGQLYGDKIEIKQGLQPGEQLITDGYQGLFEGQPVITSESVTGK